MGLTFKLEIIGNLKQFGFCQCKIIYSSIRRILPITIKLWATLSLQRLSQLEKLQALYLDNNPLGRVPDVVCSLSQLTELNLSECMLSNISDRYVYMITTPYNATDRVPYKY